jgi:hypothetical protein
MTVFYGCALLLIFGIIELTKPSTPTSGQASRLQAAHGDLGVSSRPAGSRGRPDIAD